MYACVYMIVKIRTRHWVSSSTFFHICFRDRNVKFMFLARLAVHRGSLDLPISASTVLGRIVCTIQIPILVWQGRHYTKGDISIRPYRN